MTTSRACSTRRSRPGLAPRAAVVRGQNDVAVERLFGQHIFQAGRFQVAGEQHAAAGVFDQQHDAVGVVAAEDALPRRVQHFDLHAPPPRQSLAAIDFAQRHAAAIDRSCSSFTAGGSSSNMTGET